MDETEITRFRIRSRWLLWAITAIFAAIAAMLTLTLAVVAIKFTVMSPLFLKRLGASWAPVVFYLWGLWGLRAMFKALAGEGPSFQIAVTQALTRVGWALLLGAVAGFLLTPFAAGVHHMGSFAAFAVPPLTLGVLGLALIAVSRLLTRAAVIEAQNQRLKAALQDFI